MVAPKNGKKNGEAPYSRASRTRATTPLSITLPNELMEHVDRTWPWLRIPPHIYFDRSAFVADALRHFIAKMEKLHNGGKPFAEFPSFRPRRGAPSGTPKSRR